MIGKFREKVRRPSYAEVVATLALFIALGGVSYAAIKIPANSVGTKQVKNRSLRPVDFRAGTIQDDAGPTGLMTGRTTLDGRNGFQYAAVSGVTASPSKTDEPVKLMSPDSGLKVSTLTAHLDVAPGPGAYRSVILVTNDDQRLTCHFQSNTQDCVGKLKSQLRPGAPLAIQLISGGDPAPSGVRYAFLAGPP